MTRKYFRLLIFCSVCCCFTAALSSCKSDDGTDDSQQPDDAELEAKYERMDVERLAVMELLRNLADVTFDAEYEGDIDFEGKSYEPTIGSVRDEANPLERSIRVESAADSEVAFRDLVTGNEFIRETADGLVIDLSNLDCREDGRKQNFGTLTFHRGGDGTNVGYADVNIPCIPHLERISYKTAAQWGDNAAFESPCMLGDIYLGKGVYWVCVKEAESMSEHGVLVNIEPGYGTLHNLLWDANYEADNDCFPTRSDIRAYLRLCAADWYATKKAKVIKKLDNKVFPRLCSNHSTSKFSFSVGKGDYGFAHTREDYSFYAEEGIGKEKKNGAAIVYDTNKEGSKKYKLWGSKKRYMYYVGVPYQCERDEGTEEGRYGSRSDSDFYEFYCEHWMYICNAKYFTSSVPAGFVLQNI